MNKYDLVSIVRPTADDTVVESVHKSITDVISGGGGSVSEQGVWQKRKLAYEIDTFKEGIYTIQLLKALQKFLQNSIEC